MSVLSALTVKTRREKVYENIFRGVVMVAAACAIIFLLSIITSLFIEGFNIFREIGVLKFVLGTSWYPTHTPHEFGILTLIVSSIIVTLVALAVAIPLGVGSALYVAEVARPAEREILKPFIELLAGIPSVIYGLFGMAFLSPFLRDLFNLPTGLNALNAGIILGVMVVPIISSIAEDALTSVPRSLREAALALGANKWETMVRVVLPAAKSGVFAGIVLGFGRAIGETMVVLMVAGNAVGMPHSVLQPVRPMPSTIAAEMGETVMGSPHFHALYGIAIVLFVITFLSNIITVWVRGKVIKI
jgi:phosphate transport system permease protein